MMFISVSEASKKWHISDRRVRVLCQEGRIEGAIKIGRSWSIPKSAAKPIDSRVTIKKNYKGLDYDFKLIDQLKAKIDTFRPLPKHLAQSLHDKLIVEWTYHSNAIEGNTLTLSETKVVLEGITIGGKRVVEHLETINHREAILFIEELISSHEVLSAWHIKNIHALVLSGIDKDHAGKYRNQNVVISGANHIPPKYLDLDQLMLKLMKEYRDDWQNMHPVIRATLLHGEFVKIHPFIDGNGRTARLLLNFDLMKAGYAPIVIKADQRAQYYDALDHAHTTMDYRPFIELVAQSVIDSEKLWLSVID